MRISDWSSDVCSSDLRFEEHQVRHQQASARSTGGRCRRVAAVPSSSPGSSATTAGSASDRASNFGLPSSVTGTASMPASANQSARSGSAMHRSEEHTSELQSLMRISYAVFCLKKKKNTQSQ